MVIDHKNSTKIAKHVPGEPELWIFILGDMCVFMLFFIIWCGNYWSHPEQHASGHLLVNRTFGLINTLALLTSSLFVAHSLNQVRRGLFVNARKNLYAAMVLGGCFIVIKCFEYYEKISTGITPMTNDFFMYYFVFTGIHLVHVMVGMIALMLMIFRCNTPKPNLADVPFLEGAGVYWHMVDLLWIVLFLLIYLI